MKLSASAKMGSDPSFELSDTCEMVMLCENEPAREKAKALSARLVGQLGHDLAFNVGCWTFAELAQSVPARDALETAVEADVVLFSLETNDLPKPLLAWLDTWIARRSKTEGALVLLITEPFQPSSSVGALLSTAQKLGMDFLPIVAPLAIDQPFKAAESQTFTATSTLRESRRPLYSRDWGLNE